MASNFLKQSKPTFGWPGAIAGAGICHLAATMSEETRVRLAKGAAVDNAQPAGLAPKKRLETV